MNFRESVEPLEDFIEKARLEIVARDEIVETVARAAHTGNHGDGKILVWTVEQAVGISTGEIDDSAI